MKRGKIFSAESREKIRQKALQQRHSLEVCTKIGLSQRGKSVKSRGRIQKGKFNHMFGKKGDACPNSKLTQEQRVQIAKRLQSGESTKNLAKEFNVNVLTIRRQRHILPP